MKISNISLFTKLLGSYGNIELVKSHGWDLEAKGNGIGKKSAYCKSGNFGYITEDSCLKDCHNWKNKSNHSV